MKPNSKSILKFVLITLLHLLMIFYLKYSLNKISISEFDLFYFGNLINLISSTLLILSLLVLLILASKQNNSNFKLLTFLFYLMFIPIAVMFIANLVGLSVPHGYIFGFQQRKIIYGLLFLTSLSVQIYLLQIVWGYIVSSGVIIFARSFVWVIAFITSTVLITFIYSLLYSSNGKLQSADKKYDVCVVLGAAVWSNNQPSPIFKARIEKANRLFEAGVVDKIQLTGGNAPGEISEAGAAFNMLRELGIDKSKLAIEEKTSTTSEQIKFIKENFSDKLNGIEVLIISDAFHSIRIKEMCKFYNVTADVIASEYELSWEKFLFYSFRDSISLLLFWIFAI